VEFILVRHTRAASLASVIIFLTFSAKGADSGIAARYPGDKNIGNDPAVIFADDFESYTDPTQLKSKWSVVSQNGLRIATEFGNYYAGAKALEITLQISTSEQLKEVLLNLPVEQDVVYFRAYTKFDSGFSILGSSHNGLSVRAHYPSGAGTAAPADGTGFFLAALQDNATSQPLAGELQPGYHQIYAYWPKQRDNYGDHWFSDGWVRPEGAGLWLLYPTQYPDFRAMPKHQAVRGQWNCYEIMVKANTVKSDGTWLNDGEVAWWIDGQLDGRITNLFLRSISSLKMDAVRLALHGTSSARVNKKWYDNVVIATQYIGPMASASPIPSPTPTAPAELQNISSRLLIQTGNNVGIAGFVIGGSEPKKLLIRGLGPTLTQFNVTGVMPNPTLKLYDGSGSLITTNDDWKSTQEAAITGTQLAPPNDVEAAILATLQPGAYTVIQADASGAAGVGLVEVYDLNPLASSRLLNLSTRGLVQTGARALIAGCSVAADSNDVVVRALGPSLRALGVDNALADPVVTLYDSNANVIAANDNWKDSQQSAVESAGLQPPDDVDAAILVRLARGNYTAIVTGKNGSAGIGLVEIYAVP
jgi:hypothetical protein